MYIEATIRSVLLQNYPRLEYIILDGGSTDNTLEVIRKYQAWITHWESKRDDGQAAAIQKGFEQYTGSYLSWINSDDLLCRDAIWSLASFILENKNVDFIYGRGYFYENDKLIHFEPQKTDAPLKALGSFPFVQPACFFSSSCLEKAGKIDASLDITFDYDLFVRMVLSGAKLKYIPAELAIFRRQSNAKTFRYNAAWDKDRIETFSRVLRSIEVESSLLEPLRDIGTYKEGTKKYHPYRKYSEIEKRAIISAFLHDNLYLYYADMRDFERTFQNARFLKNYLPEFFSTVTRQYLYRSFIFKNFPFLHRLWANLCRRK